MGNLEDKILLRDAINKWLMILDGEGMDLSYRNCALCKRYRKVDEKKNTFPVSCDGCPVKRYTEQDGCQGSPYDSWGAHQAYHRSPLVLSLGRGWIIECDECRTLAQKELAFLKMLYDKEKGGF